MIQLGGFISESTISRSRAPLNKSNGPGIGSGGLPGRDDDTASIATFGAPRVVKKRTLVGLTENSVRTVLTRGKEELVQRARDAYRCNWSLPGISQVLRESGNLWLTHKDESEAMIRVSMEHMQTVDSKGAVIDDTVHDYERRLAEPQYVKPGRASIANNPRAAKRAFDEHKEKPVNFFQRGGVGIISLHFQTPPVGFGDKWVLDDRSVKHITRALRTPEMVALVVCSHVPLVSQTYQFTQSFAEGGEDEEVDVPFSSVDPVLLNTIFESIFDWLGESRKADHSFDRCATIVTGTFLKGGYTTIMDRETDASVRQVCVGRPAAGHIKDAQVVPEGDINERFHYSHSFPLDDDELPAVGWPVAEVEIMAEPLRASLTSVLQPSKTEKKPLEVEIGPIMGPMSENIETIKSETGGADRKRSTFSVAIMVEMNQGSDVTCVVTDVFTHSVVRQTRRIERGRPRTFRLQHLAAERRFHITFEGKADHELSTSVLEGIELSFNTPLKGAQDFSSVVMSGDVPSSLESNDTNLWEPLIDHTKAYWGKLDLMVHLGGQVHLQRSAFEALELFRQHEAGTGDAADYTLEALEDRVKETFRTEYRAAWKLPTTNKVLRGCQHLMLAGERDIFQGFSELKVLCERAGWGEEAMPLLK